MRVEVRPFGPDDRNWAYELLFPKGGPSRVASRGVLHDPLEQSGFVAWQDGERIGLVTYRPPEDGACEILTLDSAREGVGAGTALIQAVLDVAREAGCRRVWLITTNDNAHALRFYQRRGFRLREARPGAVAEARRTIKPEIPERGHDGIPITDELELVIDL